MNAVVLKRFVQENQKLAAECANLLTQCNKWERECLLYDRDREALMDFGNEADERAKKAEIRVHDLVEDLGSLNEELRFYKNRYDNQGLNLSKAEEEAKVLFEENNMLDEANRKLLRQSREGKNIHDSGGKHTSSASAKTNKRKSSPKICSPIEKKINFTNPDSARKPLSPLQDRT
ncbi:putative RNA-binding family protein [Hibiscus syriacus]|uniref:RNA-binding family protein n=1 Tax=Hibiscus syriacus TaxID=106335 RepID=A0A6A2XXS8_HIBSY|nr:putative RNA-binding family protein [Hibiscus syriacus]